MRVAQKKKGDGSIWSYEAGLVFLCQCGDFLLRLVPQCLLMHDTEHGLPAGDLNRLCCKGICTI